MMYYIIKIVASRNTYQDVQVWIYTIAEREQTTKFNSAVTAAIRYTDLLFGIDRQSSLARQFVNIYYTNMPAFLVVPLWFSKNAF